MDFLFSLFLGASLAACAGIRAFLPLFVLGLASRLGFLAHGFHLSEHCQWLASNPALICFGAATILEISADKFPAVDHALDMVAGVVRPGAGALSVLAALNTDNPLVAYTLAIVLGAGATFPVHAFKAASRAASTLTSGGLLNPILSVVEDVFSLAGSVLAVILPVVAIFCVMLSLAGLVYAQRGLRRWFSQRAQTRGGPDPVP